MSDKIDPLRKFSFKHKSISAPTNNKMPEVPFQDIFNQAMQGDPTQDIEELNHNFNQKPRIVSEEELLNSRLIAQVNQADELNNIFREIEERRKNSAGENLEEESKTKLNTNRLEVTPFQIFIDKAIEVLESISALDYRVNDLTEQYIEGKVSVDEVSIETMKLNLAVSFATTIISSGTQAFKEITQLAI